MKEEINKVVEQLKSGKVILYPTDTIWGLGCDPENEEAIKKIYKIKKRDDSKSLIILIGEIGQLYHYVSKIPEIAWDLVEFAEKPLTIIYAQGKNVAPSVLGADGSIAIRLVKDKFCADLIRSYRKGIVSTSANISGNTSPANFSQIEESILNEVDYTVNLRKEEKSVAMPSTIIKLELNGEIKFLRK